MSLINPQVPFLPSAGKEFDAQQQNTLYNVLRLFFTQLAQFCSRLSSTVGAGYLQAPHGSFSSRVNQTPTAANTAKLVALEVTDYSNEMHAVVGDGVHVDQAGVYNYQFSLQFENSDTAEQEATIWLKKNGTDFVYSSSQVTVAKKRSSNGYTLAAANFYVSLAAGDYVEMWWATTSTNVILEASAAQTVPYARPGIPSVVVTMSFVSAL